MNFTIQREALIEALSLAEKVVDRSPIEVLSCALLRSDGGELHITTTDIDRWIEVRPVAEVVGEFDVAVNAGRFLALAKASPKGCSITCSVSDGQFNVIAGRSQTNLHTLPGTDFPMPKHPQDPVEPMIPAETLRDALSFTRFSVADDLARYFLNGVHVETRDSRLIITSTNGNFLQNWQSDAINDLPETPDIILPSSALDIISGNVTGDVTIQINETLASFAWDNVKFTTKLVDGSYPDYRRAIPTNNPNKFTLSKSAMSEAIRRVSVVSSDKTPRMLLMLTRDCITISMRSDQFGASAEEVPASHGDNDITICVNPQFLTGLMSAFSGDEICFEYGEAFGPIKITDAEKSDRLAVLMTVRQ